MRSLIAHARFLQQVKAALLPMLPPGGADHVGVADYQNGVLVLIVDSGTWATRLRYQQAHLRRALAQNLRMDLEDVVIKVRPPAQSAVQPRRRNRQISSGSRQQLAQAARYIEDTELADALRRLSQCGAGRD